MTTGSGLYINPTEKDPQKQNRVIAQLIEGRSNAVGSVTLTHDGVATTTAVTAVACGPNSIVILFPATAHAAAVVATTYVTSANIASKTFTITHAATANTDVTFWFVCLG